MNIDYLHGISNFTKPNQKKEPKIANRVLVARERQDAILELIKDKSMNVPDMAEILGHSPQLVRGDVRSLILRKLAINHSTGKNTYYVKAA